MAVFRLPPAQDRAIRNPDSGRGLGQGDVAEGEDVDGRSLFSWGELDRRSGARLQVLTDLEEDLEKQRLAEWRTYGEALKTKVEQLAAETPGLEVPVNITVDPDTFRPDPTRSDWDEDSLEGRLLSRALAKTPTPLDLPGTPLERLLGAGTTGL